MNHRPAILSASRGYLKKLHSVSAPEITMYMQSCLPGMVTGQT